MAGHSKWANIRIRKGAQDAKRGKVFTKLIREITVAARTQGGDATHNSRLRHAIDKALAANMSKDNIERAIQRGTGELEGVSYEEVRYEGYGPGGVAVMVDCTTDNRTRTVGEVRHAFTKYGGNLGQDGSVAFLFKRRGIISFAPGANEDRIMELALEAGAEDVVTNDDGTLDVLTGPDDFPRVRAAIERAGLKPEVAELGERAATSVTLAGEDAERMLKLLEVLEDLDDVQNVYTNADFPEALAERQTV
jgi:YebC/PmpR family DNA-binding regulatory protein